MKITIKLTILILFFLTACKQVPNIEENPKYTILRDSLNNRMNIEELIEECKYIQLGKGPDLDYNVGEIKKILLTEDRIFLISEGIFCFDMTGCPLYKIDQKGHAKTEFIECSSVCIDDNHIYMLDRGKAKIHVYDITNGNFIRNISCPGGIYDIKKTPNAMLIDNWAHINPKFYDGEYRFISCDENMSMIHSELLFDDIRGFNICDLVSDQKDHLLFSDYFNCKTYIIDGKGAELYLKVESSPEQQLPESVKQKIVKESKLSLGDQYIYGLNSVYETSSHIIGNISVSGRSITFVFDKNTQKAKEIVMSNRKYLLPLSIGASNDSYFVQLLDSKTIELYSNPAQQDSLLDKTNKYYAIQRTYLQHKEDDNPIIVLYKFKRIR